jgi:hypothetical protein
MIEIYSTVPKLTTGPSVSVWGAISCVERNIYTNITIRTEENISMETVAIKFSVHDAFLE